MILDINIYFVSECSRQIYLFIGALSKINEIR